MEDPRGNLTVCEFPASLPFPPVRVYWIHGIPDGSARGGHAHREVDEILIPVQGGFSVTLLSPDREKREFRVDRPDCGLFLPHGWWRNIHGYLGATVCLVLSSGAYNEEEYIRDPMGFFNQ